MAKKPTMTPATTKKYEGSKADMKADAKGVAKLFGKKKGGK